MAVYLTVRFLGVLALLSNTALGDLSCKKYVPRAYPYVNSNTGVITYSGSQGNTNIPSTNIQAANPAILNSNSPTGTTFKFETCNSTSLGFAPYTDQGEGYDAGCPTFYIDYVRIINPSSGNCLTSVPIPKSNLFKIVSKKCDPNPTTKAQFFMVNQQVLYNCEGDGDKYSTFLPAGFYAFDANTPYDDQNPYSSWVLAADNKTVEYFTANSTSTQLNAVITVKK